MREPMEVTRPVLERYQRYLFHYRKRNGEPLTFRSQHSRLVPLRMWFRWMTRQNHILHNPASELDLPRLGRVLPKNILSARRSSRSCAARYRRSDRPARPRDAGSVYSTGIRRMEMIDLKLYDLELDRGLIVRRQGKGKKDRYVPIGERAMAWFRSTSREARPQLAVEPDDLTVFLTAQGEPISRDHLRSTVQDHIEAAKTRQDRSVPSLPPHDGNADARERGRHPPHPGDARPRGHPDHADLYAGGIRALQQIHAATHSAAHLEPAPSSQRRAQPDRRTAHGAGPGS